MTERAASIRQALYEAQTAQWPPKYVSDPDPARLVRITGTDVIRTMQLALRTDPLTQQTPHRIGRPPIYATAAV